MENGDGDEGEQTMILERPVGSHVRLVHYLNMCLSVFLAYGWKPGTTHAKPRNIAN